MKRNISFPIAALACLGLAALLSATKASKAQTTPQTPTAPAAGAGRRAGRNAVAEAFKTISPTSDQQTKFDALTTTYESDLTVARAEADRQEMGRKVAAVIATYRTAAEALLTPDQLTKFKQAMIVPLIMRNLDQRLTLTADEKMKLEPILNDYASKEEGLKGAERQSLMKDTSAKIRAILTADQQTTFDTIRNPVGTGGGRRGGGGGTPPPAAPAPTTPPAGGTTPPPA